MVLEERNNCIARNSSHLFSMYILYALEENYCSIDFILDTVKHSGPHSCTVQHVSI